MERCGINCSCSNLRQYRYGLCRTGFHPHSPTPYHADHPLPQKPVLTPPPPPPARLSSPLQDQLGELVMGNSRRDRATVALALPSSTRPLRSLAFFYPPPHPNFRILTHTPNLFLPPCSSPQDQLGELVMGNSRFAVRLDWTHAAAAAQVRGIWGGGEGGCMDGGGGGGG